MATMSQGFPITPSTRKSGPYTVGAGQTVFSVTFPFQRVADLSVQVRANAGQSWSVVPGTDYSVAGAMSPAGGAVTLPGRPAGSQVRVVGKAAIASESDAVPAASFDSYTFNTAIDRVVIWMQEVRRDMDELDATGLIEVAQEAADAAVASAARRRPPLPRPRPMPPRPPRPPVLRAAPREQPQLRRRPLPPVRRASTSPTI